MAGVRQAGSDVEPFTTEEDATAFASALAIRTINAAR